MNFSILIITSIFLFLSKGVQKKLDVENYEWVRNLLIIIEVLFSVFFVLSLHSCLFKDRGPYILYLLLSLLLSITFFKVGYFLINKLFAEN